ncbi:hypothetical protein [Microbacterium sp. gxy059]|uniref:hypothetical protein n=1 Tax=Microbacterium sp. gxy059 TaxID=2957199 RepID=UPI003D97CDCF
MVEMRITEENRRHIIRMNRQLSWAALPLLAIPGPLLALAGYPRAWPIVFACCVALALLLLLSILLAVPRLVARQRIVFGEGGYTVTGWFATRRLVASDVTRAAMIDRLALGVGASAHHLVLAGNRRRLLSLVGQMWTYEQMSALATDLTRRGIPVTHFVEPTTAAHVRAVDHRFMPWRYAHPLAFALLLTAAIVLVVTVAVVAIIVAPNR